MSGQDVLRLEAIERTYRQGDARLQVLAGVDLAIRAGEAAALMAPSGAGKTTLLQIAGLLDRPDAGRVVVAGEDAARLDDRGQSRLRAARIGFVFQFHHLLPEFTALENVVLPQTIRGLSRRAARGRATELLTSLGLGQRLDHRPAALSGGEQQRVAVARALANRPSLILADEPTGNLDHASAITVVTTLLDLARAADVGLLVATHNPEIADMLDRRVRLDAGRIVAS